MAVTSKTILLTIVLIAAVIASALLFSPPPTTSTEAIIALNGITLTVELADTPQKHEKGLMFRERLADDRGMLFVFELEGPYSFWMKNVRFPLDIIWFDENRKAVFIARNLQPCETSIWPSYTPDRNAKYVLEVNGGLVDRYRISLNSTLVFVATPSDLTP